MTGEYDYGDIFLGDDGPPPFPYMSYILFIVFFILLSIILINLLVGLTVNDVSLFVEVADLKKMSMRLKFVLNMEHFQRQWTRLFSYFGIQQNFSETLYVKEKSLNIESHRGKMWKQVISSNEKEDKKSDIQDLKQKTYAIEDKIKDLEYKLKENTSEIEEKIVVMEKKLLEEFDKKLKRKAQETEELVEKLEQKLTTVFGNELQQKTMKLERLVTDRDVDMAVIMKHYEERTEAETKKEKRLKTIEDNISTILKQKQETKIRNTSMNVRNV